MSLYVVTAVRLDKQGEVESALWASVNGTTNSFNEQPYHVPVDRIVAALDHGDTVEMRFAAGGGYVSGGRLLRKVLPGGHERVREERGDTDRTLKNLPSF